MFLSRFYLNTFFPTLTAGSNKPDERARLETVLWMTIDGKLIEILTYCVMCFFFYFIKKNLKMKVLYVIRPFSYLQFA